MKNKLQYLYSIVVFVGVLSTAYLMMSRSTSTRIPLRSFPENYRAEAKLLDPAVSKLLEVEDILLELGKLPDEGDSKRTPAEKALTHSAE